MDAIGAQEVLFPALLPREPYEASGRWTEYGDLLFRLKDRKGNDYLLGPTHEELFTLMVKGEYSSYKDLPVTLYQIQTKYRDEARPRAGILRGREFVMKDSYSFDLDDEGLQRSYDQHREAYVRIFERLGLDYRIVSAVSGAMGGSATEEFLARRAHRRGHLRACTACDYAANTEAVELRGARAAATRPRSRRSRSLDTPDTPTIDTLVAVLARASATTSTPRGTLKNVVVLLRTPTGRASRSSSACPATARSTSSGSRPTSTPAEVLPFDGDFAKHPRLVRGYIGPQVLADLGIRYLVDPLVVRRQRLGDRRQRARASTRSTSSSAVTSSRTAPSRPPRCGPATPAPAAARRWRSTAASRSATSSSSAASTPTRSASTCSAPTASRSGSPWGRTASASRARSRRSPSSPTTRRAWSGRRRRARSTSTSSASASRTSPRSPSASPPSSRPRA